MTVKSIAEEQLDEIRKIKIEIENLTQAVYELREAIIEGVKYLKK